VAASYAVRWLNPSGDVIVGKLELRPRTVVLEGSSGHAGEYRELPYDDLPAVRVDRGGSGSIEGRPTLVLVRRSGEEIRVAGISPAGIVSEVAEQIAELQGAANMSRLGLVVPLKPGVRAKVEELLAQGPPFDPDEVGLERHHVLVTDEEAIFVFEAAECDALDRLAAQAPVWTAAAAWSELVAGPPRRAEAAYVWRRSESGADVFFTSTPGPGDSDGGDIFAP
jgi:hypothetical protein